MVEILSWKLGAEIYVAKAIIPTNKTWWIKKIVCLFENWSGHPSDVDGRNEKSVEIAVRLALQSGL